MTTLRREEKPALAPGSLIRVSSLDSVCARAVRLAAKHGLALNDEADAEQLWTYGYGTALHHQLQNGWVSELVTEAGDSVLQGWWKCNVCGAVHVGQPNDGRHGLSELPTELKYFHREVLPSEHPRTDALAYGWVPRPAACSCCNNTREEFEEDSSMHLFEYFELSFRSRARRLTGHSDGVLVWGPGDEEILEGKSINQRGFAFVNPAEFGAARPGHVVQGSAYAMLAGVNRIRPLYILKSDQKMVDSIAEHVLDLTPEMVAFIEATVAGIVAEIDGAGSESLPEKRHDCTSKTKMPASYCACKTPCFKL